MKSPLRGFRLVVHNDTTPGPEQSEWNWGDLPNLGTETMKLTEVQGSTKGLLLSEISAPTE